MATALFRVSVRGAGALARDFDRTQRELQDHIIAVLRELGAEAERVFALAAPEDTGDLIRALVTVPYFRARRPRVEVRVQRLRGHQGDRRDDFDYLQTTRRGHRSGVIRPRAKRALKVHIEGHRNPHAVIYRAAVRGVGHPPVSVLRAAKSRGEERIVRQAYKVSDWVVQGAEALDPAIEKAHRELGRRVERSLR